MDVPPFQKTTLDDSLKILLSYVTHKIGSQKKKQIFSSLSVEKIINLVGNPNLPNLKSKATTCVRGANANFFRALTYNKIYVM